MTFGGGKAMIREVKRDAVPGIPVLIGLVLALVATVIGLVSSAVHEWPFFAVGCVIGVVVEIVLLIGFFTVAPNQGRVLQLFGSYRGTAREPGLRWASPFYTKRTLSLRVRNFETGRLKVNDKRSN